MDQHGSVCRNAADESLLHQINDHWRKSSLDYVPTNAPDDRFLQLTRATNSFRKFSKGSHGKHVGQAVEKVAQRRVASDRFCKLLQVYFAGPRGERISLNLIEFERFQIVVIDRRHVAGF